MFRSVSSRKGLVLLVAALMLILTACGGGSDPAPSNGGGDGGAPAAQDPGQGDSGSEASLEELAKQEGTLTWYTATSIEAATALAEAFTADTGIKVEIFRQTAGPLTEAFYAEDARNDTKADVMTHSEPSTMIRFGREGLIAKYDSPEAVNLPADAVEIMQGYAYPDRLTLTTIAYNEDLITEEEIEFIKADPYKAVIDPRFKGQVSFADPNVNGTSFNHLYTLGIRMGGWDSDEAKAWYEALAANEPLIFNSNGPVADALISGEAKVGMIIESFAAPHIARGAPLALIYPEPTLSIIGITGVVAKAPHPNAARYFVDWLLSKKGQEAWNKAYDVAVGHKDAVDQRDYLVEKDWYEAPSELYFLSDLEQQDEDRTPFLEQFNAIFGL